MNSSSFSLSPLAPPLGATFLANRRLPVHILADMWPYHMHHLNELASPSRDSEGLELEHANLTDETVACLNAEPVHRFKKIDLSANPQLTTLPSGTKFPALEWLKASHCTGYSLTTVAAIFSSYPGLTFLCLACCGLTALPEDLSHSTCILEYLDLHGNKIANLPYSIAGLSYMKELNLSGNALVDSAMIALAASFKASTQLRHLFLANNLITERGALTLSRGLSTKYNSLRLLVLTGNNVKDDGCAAILASVAMCTLHTLRLDACGMSDDASRALAAAVRTNVHLRSLAIGRNQLGNEAIITLSRALEDQHGLRGVTDLDLSDNHLGADSAVALAAVLLHNSALLRLNLGGNNLLVNTSRALIALADGISRNIVDYVSLTISLLYGQNLVGASRAQFIGV